MRFGKKETFLGLGINRVKEKDTGASFKRERGRPVNDL